jgi:hypothetical protein
MENLVTRSTRLSAANQYMKWLGTKEGFPEVASYLSIRDVLVLNDEFCERHGFTVSDRILLLKKFELRPILSAVIHAPIMTDKMREILKNVPFTMFDFKARFDPCFLSLLDLDETATSPGDFLVAAHKAASLLSKLDRIALYYTLTGELQFD